MQTLIKAAEHITNVNARGCFSVFCLFAPRARTRTRTCTLNFFTSLASCSVTVLYRSYVEGTASRNLEVMGAGSLRGEAMVGGGIPKGTGAIGGTGSGKLSPPQFPLLAWHCRPAESSEDDGVTLVP